MDDGQTARARHPRNAPGPFYSAKDQCLGCDAPRSEAPSLMDFDDNGCRFRKQPEAPEELTAAIQAVVVSCCGGVRYAGDDPAVLAMLCSNGSAENCDQSLTPQTAFAVLPAIEPDPHAGGARLPIDHAEAVAIAQRVADARGWPWRHEVQARRTGGWLAPRRWSVTTNHPNRGDNVLIVIDDATGELLHAAFLAR